MLAPFTANYCWFFFSFLLLYCTTKPFVILDELGKIACKTLGHQFLCLYICRLISLCQTNTLLKQCVTSVIWGYFMLYFLSQRTPTLQFLTNVIGMSLCLHLVFFISWIQANVCDAVISKYCSCWIVEVCRRHHCALPFSIFTLM